MRAQTKIDLLRLQLEQAKALEMAALGEFRRYETPYYEKAWNRATVRSQRLAARLSRQEMRLLKNVQKRYSPA